MIRHSILTLPAIAVSALVFLPGNALAQQKSIKDQLVGSWTLTAWEQDVPNGPKLHRFGDNPKGVNIFEPGGRFAVMFLNPSLPKIASNNLSTPAPDEAKAIVGGTIAYYGTYDVNEGSKIITLHIDASSYQNQLGIDQKRTITSLTPTELKYINTTVVGNAGQIYVTLKRGM